MFNLREYQALAIDGVERHKKNLIYLATGSGKSVIFKQLAIDAIERKEKVLFIVKRQQVLSQAVNKHFLTIHNDVSMMMGARKYRYADILCCSMDTLYRRSKIHSELLKEYQTIIIDEAHDCTADNYKTFLKQVTNQTVIGLTATPFMIGKKGHDYWNKIIHPVTTLELIKQGHLVFPEVWQSEIEMKTKGVKTTAGDYNNKMLFDANDSSTIYGSIVDEYKKHGQGRRAFCFAINVEHSMKIAREFNVNGIFAAHADASTPLEDRELILKRFADGEIKILCNVNIFSTGTDVPEAEVGIMARPTKSRVLWIQQIGRLLRRSPETGKKNAIILDHTNNTKEIGHPVNDFAAEIENADKKKNDEALIKLHKCPNCFYVYQSATERCPMCNSINEPREREIKRIEDAKLRKYEFKEEEIKKSEQPCPYESFKRSKFIDPIGWQENSEIKNMITDRDRLWAGAKYNGWKPNSIYFKYL